MKKSARLLLPLLLLAGTLRGELYSLQDCVNLALKHKPTVSSAALDVSIARLGKRGSWSGILPSLSTSGSWDESNFPERLIQTGSGSMRSVSHNTSWSSRVGLNQTLYDGGIWWNRLAQADNSYLISRQLERQVHINVVANVIRAYYQVLKLQQLLDVARLNLMLATQQVELVTNQFEIGAVAKTDLLKMNVSRGQAQVQVINRDLELQNALRDLRNAMGLMDSNEPILLQEVEYQGVNIPPEQEAYTALLEQNPGVLAKRSQIRDARLSHKLTRGAQLPSLSLYWSFNYSPVGISGFISDLEESWNRNLSVNLSVPLFTGFSRSSSTQQSRLRITKSENDYLNQVHDLRVQLSNLLEVLANYREIIPINEQVLVAAEEDLRLVQEQYTLGSVTILEVLDAQLSVTEARSALVSTRYEAQIQEANLQALMGTLDKVYSRP